MPLQLPDHANENDSILIRRWIPALIILGALFLAMYLQDILLLFDSYRRLYKGVPYYVVNSGRDIITVVICLLVARLIWTRSISAAVHALGIDSPLSTGLVFGTAAALPMFVGFAVAMPLSSASLSWETAYLAGVSPLAEEIVFRGFAVGLLFTWVRLPAWAAISLPALAFGLFHVDFDALSSESLFLFLLTGTGGALFGWVMLRWACNVWIPIALHACMNLAWNIFNVSDSALGGWYPFTLQLTAALLAVIITLRWTGPIGRSADEEGLPAGSPSGVAT